MSHPKAEQIRMRCYASASNKNVFSLFLLCLKVVNDDAIDKLKCSPQHSAGGVQPLSQTTASLLE